MDRLETLKSMVAQDPANSFARYGLAMELAKLGRLGEAADQFRALIAAYPDYLYGYFHGGQTLEKLGRVEEARALYRQGVEASRRLGDQHAQSEIEGALELLG